MGIQVTDLHLLRDQLVVRRQKLESAASKNQTANLLQLLEQVTAPWSAWTHGGYGVCEACAGTVEPERLFADPLTQLCLDCLKPAEQRALEQACCWRRGSRQDCCRSATSTPPAGRWPIITSPRARSVATIAT